MLLLLELLLCSCSAFLIRFNGRGDFLMVLKEVGVLLDLMLIGLGDHFLANLRLIPPFRVTHTVLK